MHPYQIVIADDHLMFRHGIKRIIEESEDLVVVGEASDGLELLDLLKRSTPDMVILDLSMPKLRGLEATAEIKTAYPKVKILILTMHKNKEYLMQALSVRTDGYLLKEDSDTQLIAAIESIRQENIFLSPRLSEDLTSNLIDFIDRTGKPLDETLSIREKEVLTLLSEGKSSKEIAKLLFISTRTVEHHRSSINRKLNIQNIVDLVKYAIREGYTSQDS
jgi:DNA-binding NarL/FixJ family response regulator